MIRSFLGHASVLLFTIASSIALSAQGTAAGASAAQPLELPGIAPVADCATLTSADISSAVGAPTRILSAAAVNDAQSAPYCRVKAEIDHFIDFEAHLPVANWTKRLVFAGNGQLPPEKAGNFVVTSWEDLGHRGHEDLFGKNYEYRVDYGYRSLHLIVLASKALIAKYYNQAPRFSYYAACSEPGREGMVDIERFPDDFDGIVAGCAPTPMTVNNGLYHPWNMVTNSRADGSSILTSDKLPILHQAVLDQCDAADGLKDGLISDPLACHPDLTALACKPGQNPDSCLTAEQIHAVQEIYKGAHDAQGGKLTPGGPLPGSELAWAGIIAGSATLTKDSEQTRTGTALAVNYLYSDPPRPDSFKLADLTFDRATFDAVTKQHYLYDGTDPDLTAFAKAGHKLILWHGLADVFVLPSYSILYYTALQKQMGAETVDRFARFYLYPGVYHCGGGEGPATRDFLEPLILWVERGIAPGVLMASHSPGGPGGMGPGRPSPAGTKPVVDRTRPIYPYPYTAQYTGRGSIDDAGNFVQGPARLAPAELFDWFGSSFYTPGYEKWCSGEGTVFHCTASR